MARKDLSLWLDEETTRQAKKIAAEEGTSVSAMISRMVRAMAHFRGEKIEIGPITRAATGLIKLPSDKSDHELITDALMDKHGVEKE